MARNEKPINSDQQQDLNLAPETEDAQAGAIPVLVEFSPQTEKFLTPENVKKIKIKMQTFFSQPLSSLPADNTSLPADNTSLVEADPLTTTPVPPAEPIKTQVIITISFFNGLRARRTVSTESAPEICAYLKAWEEQNISKPVAGAKQEIYEAMSTCLKP